MQCIVSCLLLSTLLIVSGLTLDCDEEPIPCSDIADIAKINCQAGGKGCSVVKGDVAADDDLDYLVDAGMVKIDADLCRKKCETQAETEEEGSKQCVYYRWEDDRQGNSHCSLQLTCGPADPWCEANHYHCTTGQVGCTEDGKPEPKPCSLDSPTTYHKDKFHLVCHDISGTAGGDLNIYDPASIADIPPRTTCTTSRRCAAWADEENPEFYYYRKLAVMCGGEGEWVVVNNTGSTKESQAMIQDNSIVEPSCATVSDPCPDIELSHTGDPGFSIICDNPIEGSTLSSPNNCIVLCDNHWTMAIECGMAETGDKAWLNDWGETITDQDIKCF